MPKVTLLNQSGDNVGEIDLRDAIFGIQPNEQALFDVVKAQRAAMRQGTHKAKSRSEVRGGGRKPWRQKGTGRARQGSIRSPQWVGGGVVFGPSPRDYTLKVNRKVRRLALKSALSLKLKEESLIVLDGLTFEAPKTKSMVEVLEKLAIGKDCLIVLPKKDVNIERSANNLTNVRITTVREASVIDIIDADTLITTEDAVKAIEEVLS